MKIVGIEASMQDSLIWGIEYKFESLDSHENIDSKHYDDYDSEYDEDNDDKKIVVNVIAATW